VRSGAGAAAPPLVIMKEASMQHTFPTGRSRAVIGAVMLGLCAAAHAADDRGFKDLYAKGQANGRSGDGVSYSSSFDPVLNASLVKMGNVCVVRDPAKEPAPFKAALLLKADGKSRKLLVSPQNRFSKCMAKELASVAWPPPPQPNYAWSFEMKITVAKQGKDVTRR
jgi:hypothetical protein